MSIADHQSSKLTSIDTQVDACRVHIKSQLSLGWVMVEPPYTDDGVTGATLQRPGLRTLLEDVRRGKIDVVVVHRLDRLSRSLFGLTNLITGSSNPTYCIAFELIQGREKSGHWFGLADAI